MKTLQALHHNLRSMFLAATFLSMGLSSQAQSTIIPPSDPDNYLTSTYNGATFSTAMIECRDAGTTLSAIAMSTLNSTDIYLELGDGSFSTTISTGIGSHWTGVDVALADDVYNPGQDYNMVFTYRELSGSGYNFFFVHYKLQVNPGNITYSFMSSNQLNTNSYLPSPSPYFNARIDAVANQYGEHVPGTDMPLMDQFLILFNDGGDTWVRKYNAEMTSFEEFQISTSSNFIASDIAASVNPNAGTIEACIAATDAGGNLICRVEDVSGPSLSNYTTSYFPSMMSHVYQWGGPRIEAFSYYDPYVNPRMTKWSIVASETPLNDVYVFNELNTTGINAAPTLIGTQEYPSIAAGVGPSLISLFPNSGNRQYTYAWGATDIGDYYSNFVYFDGTMSSSVIYRVNMNTPLALTSDPSDWVSTSTSCNTGRGMVTVWNDHPNVMYKIRDDQNYQFRPGQTKVLSKTNIYPNPAVDVVNIQNADNVNAISLVNSLGALVLHQEVSSSNKSIDVSQLAAGMYQVNMTEASGNVLSRKLVIKH